MLKKWIAFCALTCSFIFNFLDANEKNYKYHLSVCAIFKNEAPYLKEWIEYHRLIGVDHFYLYNIESDDNFIKILHPYIDEGFVTLINWPEVFPYQDDSLAYKWALCTQIPAYENGVNFIAREETQWLLLLEVNEYLVCPVGNCLKDILYQYEDFTGISLSSEYFDAAPYPFSSSKKLLIQNLILTPPPEQIIEKNVSKMIFRPDMCIGFYCAPYRFRFKNDQSLIYEANKRELKINNYINKNHKHPISNRTKIEVDHRLLTDKETFSLLDEGYLIEAQDHSIFQYVNEVIKKMRQK